MNATALFESEQQKVLQDAMRELGKYYGIKDNNTFMQILIAGALGGGTNVEEPTTANLESDQEKISTGLDKLANAIISLRGDGLFTEELIKIFQDFVEGDAEDDLGRLIELLFYQLPVH